MGNNKTVAYLCNSCGFGSKKDNCCKMWWLIIY